MLLARDITLVGYWPYGGRFLYIRSLPKRLSDGDSTEIFDTVLGTDDAHPIISLKLFSWISMLPPS